MLKKENEIINCLSNEIKDLIPSLITRIEYNKIIATTGSNTDLEKSKKCKEETVTFLKDLKRFVDVC